MLVRELIRDATWTAAEGFEALEPQVTIVLPTFRRGDSGGLLRCIESVRAQTFQNWELIVVDDASTDSTRAVVADLIERDSRIAVIRHGHNVGLPAISAYEAITRGRAPTVLLTFDDNELEPDALQTLWDYRAGHPEARIVYGIAEAPTSGGVLRFGDAEFSLSRLRTGNYVPQGASLVDRVVYDTVGYCDPHIAMTRFNDWDFWLRAAEVFEFHPVKRLLSREFGTVLSDSLGNSHLHDQPLLSEWMDRFRNRELEERAFLDYDVASVPADLSPTSRGKIESLARARFPRYLRDTPEPESGYVLLICESVDEAVESALRGARSEPGSRLVVVDHARVNHWTMIELLFGANCVILTDPDTSTASLLATRLAARGVPHYSFDSVEFASALDRGDLTITELLRRHPVLTVTETMALVNEEIRALEQSRESVISAGLSRFRFRELTSEVSVRVRRKLRSRFGRA